VKPIIEVRNLSKKYKIGERQRYLSLRDSVSNIFSSKNTEGSVQINKSEFWALDDVNFDIQAGESVGIIGRNGAGKSTLLKILSRITPPTKGSVILRGRMASLLEVGTGFHPELTGRENVFMNGSILGLKKREIEAKFDEIVDFSGVEQFIDTPLKHFSSGMQLRLAFSVAAHLEPEILVIDEVLAVGDAEFQKRCLGKMDEVSRSGRTVLFVSHSMSHVQQLCNRGIILDKGKSIYTGDIIECLETYKDLIQKNVVGSKILDYLEIKKQVIKISSVTINDNPSYYQELSIGETDLERYLHGYGSESF
jgi:lipopolysaccharide transport system ATP-binding protein